VLLENNSARDDKKKKTPSGSLPPQGLPITRRAAKPITGARGLGQVHVASMAKEALGRRPWWIGEQARENRAARLPHI